MISISWMPTRSLTLASFAGGTVIWGACWLTAMWACAAGEPAPPTANVLLQWFAATQEKQKSFVLKCEDKVESSGNGRSTPFLLREVREVRSDGQRCYIHTSESQGNDGIPNLPLWRLWDGRRMFTYSHARQPENDYLIIDKISVSKANLEAQGYDQGPSRGYLGQDKERVDSILRQASKISVRPRMERANDSDCWVIDAVATHGKYTLWIDPGHGYNLARAEVVKSQGDRDGDTVLPKNTSIQSSVVNARFLCFDQTWVPAESRSAFAARSPESWFLAKTSHKITEFTVNPDHPKLGSFRLMPIRNGAQVVISGAPKTPAGRWRDGEIFDSEGKPVDLAKSGYEPFSDLEKVRGNSAASSFQTSK